MIFDILGDTERTGPLFWNIERKRIEDIYLDNPEEEIHEKLMDKDFINKDIEI